MMQISGKEILRGVVGVVGGAVAGPAGAILGGFAGGLLGGALPFVASVMEGLVTELTDKSIRSVSDQIIGHFTPPEKTTINHDLQKAFREALREALYDCGGRHCFPGAWRSVMRDVPAGVAFSESQGSKYWQKDSTLGRQICDCLKTLEEAVEAGQILPLYPVQELAYTSVDTYLNAETPQVLNTAFFSEVIAPHLKPYGSLIKEVPELEAHLQRHLLDRTLVHLGEQLKTNSEAWRTFNRRVLEEIRQQTRAVEHGQVEMVARLDSLLAQPQGPAISAWSNDLADLISATGQVEKKLEDSYTSLLERVVAQHQEVLQRLDSLSGAASRIESQVQRVLHVLEDGRWQIEGTAPVSPDERPAPGTSPFKGLESFDASDSQLFFGREQLTARLVARLRQQTFLAVIGASGSGKSSAVRAGLVPALQRGERLADGTLPPTGSAGWLIVTLTPTAHPLEALVAALPQASTELVDVCLQDKRSLDRHARKLLGSSSGVLLVVDQFEELFTLCRAENERAAFLDNLLYASGEGENGVLRLVITLRADFYAHCAAYDSLRQVLSRCQEYIGAMNPGELQRAIEEPARQGGWSFERGLVEIILRDVGQEPGALPLLSHALLETWKRRRGHTMTLESYAESGGVRGAIALSAESVYSRQFTPPQQVLARRIFLRLTELGDGTQATRRRAALDELTGQDAQPVQAVLRALADARLVTIHADTVDVAHEALIREWPTLRQWLEDSAGELRVQRHLTEAAYEWQRLNLDEGLLYRGARLAEAQEWAAAHVDEMSLLEQRFLQTSRALVERLAAEQQAQRQREMEKSVQLADVLRKRVEEQALSAKRLQKRALYLTIALAAAAFLAVAAAILGIRSDSNARAARDNARTAEAASTQALNMQGTAEAERGRAELQARLARSSQLAAQARAVLEGNPQRGLLFAVEALNLSRSGRVVNIPAVEEALWYAVSNTGGKPMAALPGAILAIAYSPDGEWLAVAGDDDQIRLWRADELQAQPRLLSGHADKVTALAFSPDSRQLASASWDATVRLWEVNNGQAQPGILKANAGGVESVAFSPEGDWLASGGWDKSVLLWDLRQPPGTAPQVLSGHTEAVSAVAFSPDGRWLASGSHDKTLRVWDRRDLQAAPRVLQGHTNAVDALAFSPDSHWLASGSEDYTARLWDLSNLAAAPQVLSGHINWVSVVRFSPDGKWLATGGFEGQIRLWPVSTAPGSDPAAGVQVLRGHEGRVSALTFSADGLRLVSGGWDKQLRVWDVQAPVTQPKALATKTFFAAFSPDGHWLAADNAQRILALFDLNKNGAETAVPPATRSSTSAAAFSPDSRWLASGTFDGMVILQDLTNPTAPARLLSGSTDFIFVVAFSKDGRWLASGSEDGTVHVWRMDALDQPAHVMKENHGQVYSLAFSPDGHWLAWVGTDGRLQVQDLADWSQQPKIVQASKFALLAVTYSPDGKWLAVGGTDRTLNLLSTADLDQPAQVYIGHEDAISSLAFSPDGRWVASGSTDSSVRLWDLANMALPPVVLQGHEYWVQAVSFSPDSRWLASAVWDGKTRLWTLDYSELSAAACLAAGRNLNRAEWSQYFPGETYRQTCTDWPVGE